MIIMDNMFLRAVAIILHALANFVAVSYLLNYDITSSWLATICFVVVVLLLLFLFIKHIVSFINFIKTHQK